MDADVRSIDDERTSSALGAVSHYVDRPWRMLINGELRSAVSGATTPVIHPGDGSVIANAPDGDAADVDQAVEAAQQASAGWAAVPITERAAALLELAAAVEQNGSELAWIDTLDNGSPISVMRNDFVLAVEQLRYFAGLALQLRGETIPTKAHDAVDFTLRDPFGVVGRLIPFNHPLMFAASRIAAPLLAGNCVVLKPSEQTSLSALRVGEFAAEIFPAGVLNVVTGTGATVGERIVTHPGVPRIAFTGSEAIGRHILASAAATAVKTVTLELGGKNPLLVFADADVNAAIDGAVRGMNFRWQGQSCGSTSRVLVHRSLFEPFVAELARRMELLTVGDPLLESTDVGPVVSEAQYRRVRRYIDIGLSDPHLELLTGGSELDLAGYFIPPTLFAAPDGAHGPLFTEEIFGPVLMATPFDTYDEAIALANSLPLGLTASVWTTDLRTAMAAARDLQTGYLWVNWSSEHIAGDSVRWREELGTRPRGEPRRTGELHPNQERLHPVLTSCSTTRSDRAKQIGEAGNDRHVRRHHHRIRAARDDPRLLSGEGRPQDPAARAPADLRRRPLDDRGDQARLLSPDALASTISTSPRRPGTRTSGWLPRSATSRLDTTLRSHTETEPHWCSRDTSTRPVNRSRSSARRTRRPTATGTSAPTSSATPSSGPSDTRSRSPRPSATSCLAAARSVATSWRSSTGSRSTAVNELFEDERVRLLLLFKISLFGTVLYDQISTRSPMGALVRGFDLVANYQVAVGGSIALANGADAHVHRGRRRVLRTGAHVVADHRRAEPGPRRRTSRRHRDPLAASSRARWMCRRPS